MHPLKSTCIFLIVAIMVGIMVWRYTARHPVPAHAGVSHVSPATSPFEKNALPLPKPIRHEDFQNKTVATSSELLDRYNAGTNMRDFVAYALQHPEIGGYFYANQVLRECHGVRIGTDIGGTSLPTYTLGEDSGRFLKTTQAADAIRRRCADFLPDELENNRTSDLWEKGKTIDPLIKATDRYTRAFSESLKNPESVSMRRTAMEDILKTADPLVVDTLGLRLAIDSEHGKRGYFIDGRFHDLNSDVDVGLALSLLPCGMGLDCGPNEFNTLLKCATGGDCLQGRFQQTETMLREKPGSYAKVLALYESMVTAVQRGDARFFIRH